MTVEPPEHRACRSATPQEVEARRSAWARRGPDWPTSTEAWGERHALVVHAGCCDAVCPRHDLLCAQQHLDGEHACVSCTTGSFR